MQRERVRERAFDLERADTTFGDDERLVAKDDTIEEVPMDAEPEDRVDVPITPNESKNDLPAWLNGMRPIPWTDEVCRKTTSRGRNCCLFYPLNYCRGMDVINGFCVFHLKAVFNLVFQSDCCYRIDEHNRAIMATRSQCFVGEPQHMDDRVTAIFPVLEMFAVEPRPEDLKMHNLARYLQRVGTQKWERVYSLHVNFLYNLVTLRSYVPQNQQDQMLNSQLIIHWNLWNEYHSWLLTRYPAKLHLFYANSSDEVRTIDVTGFTAITQMIVRLFSVPYTSLDNQQFYSTVANYGIHIRNHLSCINNLCSLGTMCTNSGQHCVGNIATLPYIRTDKSKRALLHYTREKKCDDDFFVKAKVNPEAPTLNRLAATNCVSNVRNKT